MSDKSTLPRLFTPHLLIASIALGSAAAAAQERSPYYIGVTQGFTRDSNVFRTANSEIADTYSSTGLIAGIDQRISRQRVFADGSVQVNRYKTVEQLDNTSYSLNGGLDWATIEFLSGTLHYTTARNQANFGIIGQPAATGNNLETTQQFAATARYEASSDLAFDVSAEHRSVDYSDPASASRNYKQNVGGGGLRWGKPDILTIGIGGRVTKGEAPEFSPTEPREDKLSRKDADLIVNWVASGFSTVKARLSVTRESHTLATGSDVRGQTGAIYWDYRPTPKLAFNTSLIRDTGSETTFATTGTGTEAGSTLVNGNRLVTSAALSAKYEVTSKIRLSGAARHARGTSVSSEDKVQTYTLEANYSPTRFADLGCNYLRETRTLTVNGNYAVNVVGCTLQLMLR